ncbi:MAG: DNA helicase RecQ [Desulfobacterales bacterium]
MDNCVTRNQKTEAPPSQRTDTPLDILRNTFGFSTFREHQETIINHIISGGDAFVLMPTGSGKSICYQIPAMIRPGVAVVVSPLIALMQDQTEGLHQMGIRADYLNSSLTPSMAAEVERQVRDGKTDLLYAAPERVMMPSFQRLLNEIPVALFAIDEAHCISQWGHDFRREYLQLSQLADQFPKVPRIALTATADLQTRQEIIQKLHLQNARQFISSFDRPNIRYLLEPRQNGFKQLTTFLKHHVGHSGLVYCLTRKKAEQIAVRLMDMGYTALPYHAGMESGTRAQHQRRFLREDGIIVVATVAFGMGIDKPDVRFVVHMGMPQSMEGYYQETGRAGRDGEPADAYLLYSLADVVTLRAIMAASEADETFKRNRGQKIEAMLGYCEATCCRRTLLLGYFGEDRNTPCGNCDVCQEKVETWDGSVAAQKVLSCVYRTSQRFGAEHLVHVLLGIDNDKIRRFGHHKISTFGIGQELSQKEWKAVIRQLLSSGFLLPHPDGKGGFCLSSASRTVLKGEKRVFFRKDSVPVQKSPKVMHKTAAARIDLEDPIIRELWEKLRALRTETARALDVPPYVVFHDATLKAMVRTMPRTPEDMMQLQGIGKKKCEQFGQSFLSVIRRHTEIHGIHGRPEPALAPDLTYPATGRHGQAHTQTLQKTLDLFEQGMSPETIAQMRDFALSTIKDHLAKLIEAGKLTVHDVVSLPDDEISEIEDAFLANDSNGNQLLKPVFEKFEQKYDYDTLRFIRAGLLANGSSFHLSKGD